MYTFLSRLGAALSEHLMYFSTPLKARAPDIRESREPTHTVEVETQMLLAPVLKLRDTYTAENFLESGIQRAMSDIRSKLIVCEQKIVKEWGPKPMFLGIVQDYTVVLEVVGTMLKMVATAKYALRRNNLGALGFGTTIVRMTPKDKEFLSQCPADRWFSPWYPFTSKDTKPFLRCRRLCELGFLDFRGTNFCPEFRVTRTG